MKKMLEIFVGIAILAALVLSAPTTADAERLCIPVGGSVWCIDIPN